MVRLVKVNKAQSCSRRRERKKKKNTAPHHTGNVAATVCRLSKERGKRKLCSCLSMIRPQHIKIWTALFVYVSICVFEKGILPFLLTVTNYTFTHFISHSFARKPTLGNHLAPFRKSRCTSNLKICLREDELQSNGIRYARVNARNDEAIPASAAR